MDKSWPYTLRKRTIESTGIIRQNHQIRRMLKESAYMVPNAISTPSAEEKEIWLSLVREHHQCEHNGSKK